MTLLSAEHPNTLVILGMGQLSDQEAREELAKKTGGEYVTAENSQRKDGIIVCRLEESKLLNVLATRLHGSLVRGEKIIALSLEKYLALYRIGQKSLGVSETEKPAVKKITSEEEIAEWKQSLEGEQFVIYNENKLTNYQLTRIFRSKATKTKLVPNSKVTIEDELVVVQRQKNLFVYGGGLDLLDGFVKDNLVSYRTYGRYIAMVTKVGADQHLCEVYDLYTKEKLKHLEYPEEETLAFSTGMTHYLVQHEGKLAMRLFSTDEPVLAEQLAAGSDETVAGFLSEHNNAFVLAKTTSVGTKISLFDLDTGEAIRTRMFNSVDSFQVEFHPNEVAIIYARLAEDKATSICYLDIWDMVGDSSISRALGEAITKVHIGSSMVIALDSSHARIFKRVQGRLLESSVIRGVFSLVAINTVSALIDINRLLFVNKDGEVLYEVELDSPAKMEWSPFGMYLALIDQGQVRIIDLTGKEMFAANIASETSFFWRPIFKGSADAEISQEVIRRFKEEDAEKKKEAKRQFLEENQELVTEWAEFLQQMQRLYITAQ